MIDLQQISVMLKHAGRRSLLIVDEFGKGTDSVDGAGLLGGLLKHLMRRKEECPKVVVSTHFHEIFERDEFLGLSADEKKRIGFGHMEVQMGHKDRPSRDEIGYLYNYRPGRSNMSLGIQCARLHGIPASVVARAQRLNELLLSGGDLATECAEPERNSAAAEEESMVLREAERTARRFVSVRWAEVEAADVRRRLEEVVNGQAV